MFALRFLTLQKLFLQLVLAYDLILIKQRTYRNKKGLFLDCVFLERHTFYAIHVRNQKKTLLSQKENKTNEKLAITGKGYLLTFSMTLLRPLLATVE